MRPFRLSQIAACLATATFLIFGCDAQPPAPATPSGPGEAPPAAAKPGAKKKAGPQIGPSLEK